MAGEHCGPRAKRRRSWVGNWRGKSKDIHRGTIGANIVLIGAELSTFGGDTLEVLLCRCIRIANLEEKTFFANGLTMKFLDNLLADIARLESNETSAKVSHLRNCFILPGKANTTAVVLMVTENSARLNSVVHEDSAELLYWMLAVPSCAISRGTNGFGHILRQIRNIKICRALVALGFKARVERLL